jgi:PIN domain nuclease of toxin-antitoxin system
VILLDTHALIWLALQPALLSKAATRAIRVASAKGELAISAITCWEVALLCARRRIEYTGTIVAFVEKLASRAVILSITPAICAAGAELPLQFPKDPSDRIIAATALLNGIPLVSKDDPIRRSGVVKAIW